MEKQKNKQTNDSQNTLWSLAILDHEEKATQWISMYGMSRINCQTTTRPEHVQIWTTEQAASHYQRTPAARGIKTAVLPAPPLNIKPPEVSHKEEILWALKTTREKKENHDIKSLWEQKAWSAIGITTAELRLKTKEIFTGDIQEEIKKIIQVCNKNRITPEMIKNIYKHCPLTSEQLDCTVINELVKPPEGYFGFTDETKRAFTVLNSLRQKNQIVSPFNISGAAVTAALIKIIGYDEWNSRTLYRTLISENTDTKNLFPASIFQAPKGLYKNRKLLEKTERHFNMRYFPLPGIQQSEAENIISTWNTSAETPQWLPTARKTSEGNVPIYTLWIPPHPKNPKRHPTSIVAATWSIKHQTKTTWKESIEQAYERH